MRVIAIGNSHLISLTDSWSELKSENIDIDFVPLNLCATHHHVVPKGAGLIKFREGTLPDLNYDLTNYDCLIIVGAFVGGDGLFRSLVSRTCFTPLSADSVATLPAERVRLGANNRHYLAPTLVSPSDSTSNQLCDLKSISDKCAETLYEDQIKLRANLFNLKSISAKIPKTIWFESPIPKKTVFSEMWGEYYVESEQVEVIKRCHDNALNRVDIASQCEFIRFPHSMTDEGLWLKDSLSATKNRVDIHAGKDFGKFILEKIRA